MKTINKGVWYAVCAYTFWGLLPLYWKIFESKMNAVEILTHRVIWSFVFVGLIILIKKRGKETIQSLKFLKSERMILWSSLLISTNWLIYIWAVTHDQVVETSIGYYINPLVSVLLGILFLKERPRKLQWISIFLALIGVLNIALHYGKMPWVALSLAFTFGFYGLIKKKMRFDALTGLMLETVIVLPIALLYTIYITAKAQNTTQYLSGWGWVALLLAGVATATPLLWFAEAAKRLPLSMVGFFQYLAPSIMLGLGVLIFKEPFSNVDMISFILIWSALILFTISSFKKKQVVKSQSSMNT